jgi:hypothetical protein
VINAAKRHIEQSASADRRKRRTAMGFSNLAFCLDVWAETVTAERRRESIGDPLPGSGGMTLIAAQRHSTTLDRAAEKPSSARLRARAGVDRSPSTRSSARPDVSLL